jgi:hypothetical protein
VDVVAADLPLSLPRVPVVSAPTCLARVDAMLHGLWEGENLELLGLRGVPAGALRDGRRELTQLRGQMRKAG